MLYNYRKIDTWIADCEKELQEIQDKISVNYDVGISVISDMPHGTGISDKTYNSAERIEKLKETFSEQVDYLNDRIKKYYTEKRNVEHLLDMLELLQREVAEKRYFQNLSWHEIISADKKSNPKTYKSESTWHKAHTNMIKNIKKLMK